MGGKWPMRALALVIVLATSLFSSENFILLNEGILPKKTVDKINEIGNELLQKTGVHTYVAVVQQMDTKKIVDFEKNLSSTLPKPYVLLTLAIKNHKVDIISSPDVSKRFDKEEILSPLPWKGTIIPILTSHSKNPQAAIEAAILNGYAQIAEEIAQSYGKKLKSGLGNTNRNIYYWLRILFYSILALIFLNFIYRRVLKK